MRTSRQNKNREYRSTFGSWKADLISILSSGALVVGGAIPIVNPAILPNSSVNPYDENQIELSELYEHLRHISNSRLPQTTNSETLTGDADSINFPDYRDYSSYPRYYNEDEPDEVTLARLIYAETRGEWENPEILKHKGSSVLNTVEEDGSIRSAIFKEGRYIALVDGNRKYFNNPSEFIEESEIEKKAWERCYEIAQEMLVNGAPYKTTHTWHKNKDGMVNGEPQVKPYWAKVFPLVDEIPTTRGDYYFYEERN
ncbi:hypothetical protein CMI46_02320 [Candidatus Pacearchaeota archaeon]|nr:hypothetical protein [Candidatus Pacearchaeota archaeon]